MEVEASQVGGPDNNLYGVILRKIDEDNFYWFGISGEGSYRFGRFENDEPSSIVEGTTSTINLAQATNLIKVVCEGDSFTFFVNGEVLPTSIDSSTFARGDIGLFAAKGEEEGDVHISFDNLKVWAIE